MPSSHPAQLNACTSLLNTMTESRGGWPYSLRVIDNSVLYMHEQMRNLFTLSSRGMVLFPSETLMVPLSSEDIGGMLMGVNEGTG